MQQTIDRALDNSIAEVAELFHVPSKKRAFFYKEVRGLVLRESQSDMIFLAGKMHKTRDVARFWDKWTEDRFQIIEAMGSIEDAALHLQSLIRDYDVAYGKRDRVDDIGPVLIDTLLKEILRWVKKPRQMFLEYEEGEERQRGRPKGSESHRELTEFLFWLMYFTDISGGHFSCDKNRGLDGTLVRAAQILAPCLPAGFIPRVLPVRAVLRALAFNRKRQMKEFFDWSDPAPNDTARFHKKLAYYQRRNKNSGKDGLQ